MNIISILSLFSFLIYLYLGLHVFFVDLKSKVNRLFFFMCISLSVWSFLAVFVFSAPDKKNLLFCFRISTLGWIPFFAFSLIFFIELTRIIKLRFFYIIIIFIPGIILIYQNITSYIVYKDFIKIGRYWQFISAPESFWFYFYFIYYVLYITIIIILLFMWNKRVETIKERSQSKIILISLFTCLLIITLEGMVLPLFTSYRTYGLAPIIVLIWIVGIWYSIIRYRLMVLTLEIANNYILANIDESIILLDNKLKIMTINNKTVELLDYPADILKTYYIYKIILESKSIKTELNKIQISKSNDFSCRVHFIKKDNSNILMDTKFKVIKDKFTDILGILIIGKEVKELKQFNKLYKITSRQSEIIQKMISGKSNRQIAQSLGVSERTIKGHITNIYYKLGVNNKMQLLNLLKDFNLISAQPAEKPFFLLKKK